MSKEKTPDKESKKSNKTEKKDTAAPSDTSDKAADGTTQSSNDTSAEKSSDVASDKTATPNKSASQASISHFSSVTTKEYRSGWEAIFGPKKSQKKIKSKGDNKLSLPIHIEIKDKDIKDDLRVLLYKAFQRQARKDGVSLSTCKRIGIINYSLECDIVDK
jgi:hypothetical protein